MNKNVVGREEEETGLGGRERGEIAVRQKEERSMERTAGFPEAGSGRKDSEP